MDLSVNGKTFVEMNFLAKISHQKRILWTALLWWLKFCESGLHKAWLNINWIPHCFSFHFVIYLIIFSFLILFILSFFLLFVCFHWLDLPLVFVCVFFFSCPFVSKSHIVILRVPDSFIHWIEIIKYQRVILLVHITYTFVFTLVMHQSIPAVPIPPPPGLTPGH